MKRQVTYSVSGCSPKEEVRVYNLSYSAARAWVTAYKARHPGWAAYMYLQNY